MARHSTAVRLSDEEEASIASAARLRGQDTRTFIREAAKDAARELLEAELYKQHLLSKLREVAASRKKTKAVSNSTVLRDMRKKWR